MEAETITRWHRIWGNSTGCSRNTVCRLDLLYLQPLLGSRCRPWPCILRLETRPLVLGQRFRQRLWLSGARHLSSKVTAAVVTVAVGYSCSIRQFSFHATDCTVLHVPYRTTASLRPTHDVISSHASRRCSVPPVVVTKQEKNPLLDRPARCTLPGGSSLPSTAEVWKMLEYDAGAVQHYLNKARRGPQRHFPLPITQHRAYVT